MACDKKINNKIKLSKFWAMGGRCYVELWPELPHMLGKQWYFCANSFEKLADVYREILNISFDAVVLKRIKVNQYQLVRSVGFLLDGFWYEYNDNVWMIRENDYLFIKERAFR